MDARTDSTPAAPLTHKERRLIVWGVLLPVFLGSADQTILASALPTIGRDIGHVTELPWLITAYLLASTAATPLFGKVSDIRGRRFTLCAAIVIYIVGSLACALAPNFLTLVIGRAIHGIGGGGLTSLAMVVLGDVAAPKDRGRYYAYFSATYVTAGAGGPLLGGLIAEHLHWKMLFWMNIPLGCIALAVVSTLLRRLPRRERPHQLDLAGAALIIIASVSFMLALNIGGVRYAWASPPVLLLLAAAGVTGVCFVARLLTAPEPLIPLAILTNSQVGWATAANTFGWGAIIGLNIYLPAYLQTVLGLTATQAGLSLMVVMGTVNIGAAFGGQIMGRVEHYKLLPMAGLAVSIAGVGILAWYADTMTPLWFQVVLAIIGLGFGPSAPLSTVLLQNSVQPHQHGTAMGTMIFTRNLYATMLVAVFGAIVSLSNPLGAATVPAEGFRLIFLIAMASLVATLISIWLMREDPLLSDEH